MTYRLGSPRYAGTNRAVTDATTAAPVGVEVSSYEAIGDGTTNDTAAFTAAAAAVPVGGALVLESGKTYLIDAGIPSLGDNRTVIGNGATLKRRANAAAPLLTLGNDCAVLGGLTIDGNKSALAASTAAERGLVTGARFYGERITSSNNYGAGIRCAGTAGSGGGGVLIGPVTIDNGANPGVSGTGDGIYCQNLDGFLILNPVSRGNARTNIVATTSTPSATDSTGVTIVNPQTSGAGYNEVNTEHVTAAHIVGGKVVGLVSFGSSPGVRIDGLTATEIKGVAANRPVLRACELTGTATETLHLTGNSPDAEVSFVPASTPGSGNLCVIDPADGRGRLVGRMTDCFNGFVLDIGAGFSADLDITATANVAYKITHPGGQAQWSTASKVTIDDGKITVRGTAAPVADVWQVGDRVQHTTPAAAGNIGWVCTTAGTPGTWKTYGAIAS